MVAVFVHFTNGLSHDGGNASGAQQTDMKHSDSSCRRSLEGRLFFLYSIVSSVIDVKPEQKGAKC